jgi:hypothetical protein
MPELSNLLRQRLSADQNGEGKHPDADTLTAMVEQLLPAAERQKVLTHLSACGQCREVVALSQPQLPELVTQPVIKLAPVLRWRRLFTPTFGLAAAAATMAIIAVVVLQTQQKSGQQPQPGPEAKVTQPANVTADAQANPSTPAQPEMAKPALDQAESTRNRANNGPITAAAPPAKTAPANNALAVTDSASLQPAGVGGQPVFRADLRKKDFVNTGIIFAANTADNFGNSINGNSLPSAPQPQPLASEAKLTSNVQGPITLFQDIPPTSAANKSSLRMMTPAPPPDHFNCPVCKVVERGARGVLHHVPGAAPAINGNALSFSAMGGQGKFSADLQKEQPAEVATAPEKPANVDGLQRFEGLNRRSMAVADAAAVDSPAIWKVLGGKLVKSSGPGQWEEAYPGASFQFAIVSARGNEVWAGGTQASIIHSRDGGKTWEAPKLGDSASGSIVSILFNGSIIQLKTSDNQSWLSSDGGKTWTEASQE